MITLALAQMVFFVCLQAPFTGGEDGLQGVPRGNLFGAAVPGLRHDLYYVVLAIFVACFLGIVRIVTSPFGQVLKMIRENEPRADLAGLRSGQATSCWPSCCRPRWPGWPARSRRW